MDNVSKINFTSNNVNIPNRAQTAQQNASYQTVPNGDKKSMDFLSWAGKIAAATVAIGAAGYGIYRGKGIDPKYVDMERLARDGIAQLNENGKNNIGRISRFINQIDSDGVVRSARIVQHDGDKTIKTIVRNGRRIANETTTVPIRGHKPSVTREFFDDSNNIVRRVTPEADTTIKIGDGTQTRIIRKRTGSRVDERTIEIATSGDEKVIHRFIARPGETIETNTIGDVTYTYGVLKRTKGKTETFRIIDGTGVTEFALIDNGKKIQIVGTKKVGDGKPKKIKKFEIKKDDVQLDTRIDDKFLELTGKTYQDYIMDIGSQVS